MSDGVPASSGDPQRRSAIGNSQDFYGGLILVAFAAFALWASRDLPGMRGFAFGPGTGPRIFAMLLGAFGALIAVMGYFTKGGPGLERFAIRSVLLGALMVFVFVLISRYTGPLASALGMRQGETVIAALVVLGLTIWIARGPERGPLYVTTSILIFAGTIRPLGLVLASFVSIVVSAFASLEVRWRETILWAAALTAFCAFLFPYALNLPFSFWPRF